MGTYSICSLISFFLNFVLLPMFCIMQVVAAISLITAYLKCRKSTNEKAIADVSLEIVRSTKPAEVSKSGNTRLSLSHSATASQSKSNIDLAPRSGLPPESENAVSPSTETIMSSTVPSKVNNATFKQVWDASSSRFYYVNILTQETQWDEPPQFVPADNM